MAKVAINIASARCCAFCKYWWDPACKWIHPNIGTQWLMEDGAKCRCIVKGLDTSAFSSCGKYKCKVELN